MVEVVRVREGTRYMVEVVNFCGIKTREGKWSNWLRFVGINGRSGKGFCGGKWSHWKSFLGLKSVGVNCRSGKGLWG